MIINCPHCNMEINIEDAQSGKLECPLCHGHIHVERETETVVTTRGEGASKKKILPNSKAYTQPPPPLTPKRSSASNVIFILAALAMMGLGGLVTMEEFTSRTETVYQQIAARIGMLGGVCLFGFGFLALVLCAQDRD